MILDIPSIPFTVLVLMGVGSPALLLALLGVASLLSHPLPERWTGRLAGSSMIIRERRAGDGVRCVWNDGHRHPTAVVWYLVDIARGRYRDRVPRQIDSRWRLRHSPLPSLALCPPFRIDICTEGASYNRYFVLFAIFVTGMLLVALAGNVAVLFVGWELVGLSSALLVAFFQERPAAVSNAYRVVSVYRISDAAMFVRRSPAAARRRHRQSVAAIWRRS